MAGGIPVDGAGGVPVHNQVWDGSAWVPETQPGGGAGSVVQIADGVTASIKATVQDYADSKPLAVVLTDTSGDPYVATGATGAVTIADGADVAEGATTDAAVGDSNGTVNAHARFTAKVLADVWDSVNHWFKVSIQNATLAVTQSGSWVLSAGSAIIGKVGIDQTTPGTTNGVQVNAALPAGTNVIGHVIVDSGTITTGGLTDTQLRATPVPISGTVTANAGTNLNTSALALEAGHLATIDTSTAAVSAVAGTTSGAAVITDTNGTIQQYLRGIVKLAITAGGWLVTATLAAGNAIIGKVGIDQTTPGTTDSVSVATAQGAGATIGVTSGAKVITDANGTLQQYLRGLIYQLITAGASFFTPTPGTTGGWTYSLKNALSNTNSQVKSGQGTLGGYYIYNPNSSVAYVQIYDTATGSITVGTTTPKLSIGIPATSAANLDSACGIQFGTAICVAATTTATGGTAPSTALDCNFWYK